MRETVLTQTFTYRTATADGEPMRDPEVLSNLPIKSSTRSKLEKAAILRYRFGAAPVWVTFALAVLCIIGSVVLSVILAVDDNRHCNADDECVPVGLQFLSYNSIGAKSGWWQQGLRNYAAQSPQWYMFTVVLSMALVYLAQIALTWALKYYYVRRVNQSVHLFRLIEYALQNPLLTLWALWATGVSDLPLSLLFALGVGSVYPLLYLLANVGDPQFDLDHSAKPADGISVVPLFDQVAVHARVKKETNEKTRALGKKAAYKNCPKNRMTEMLGNNADIVGYINEAKEDVCVYQGTKSRGVFQLYGLGFALHLFCEAVIYWHVHYTWVDSPRRPPNTWLASYIVPTIFGVTVIVALFLEKMRFSFFKQPWATEIVLQVALALRWMFAVGFLYNAFMQ